MNEPPQRRPPEPMSDTLRGIGRTARSLGTGSGRRRHRVGIQERVGRWLIVSGAVLLLVAVIGAIVVALT